MNETCASCKYFRESALRKMAVCAHELPTLVPIPGPGGTLANPGVWPMVQATDWCGKHESAPAKLV